MPLKKILNLKKTLLFRLTILYAGIFFLSTFFLFTLFYIKVRSVAVREMDKELIEEVDAYTIMIKDEGLENVWEEINDEAENEDPEEEFYRIVTFEGSVIESTDLSSWSYLDIDEGVKKLRNGNDEYVRQTVAVPGTGDRARVISAIIADNIVLQIGETLEEAEIYLQNFRNWFIILLILVMIFSSIIGWLMAKRALLDMEDVTRTAFKISKGAYDQRVQVKDRFEEISRLGGAFNNMLDRIQNLLESMREVNDNIAHDLRSPLTRIRGIAEMSLMSKSSNDDYKNMAANTIEECDRLIDMVNTMLEITEVESGISKAQLEELNIVKLLHEACELFRPIATEKNIQITEKLPQKLSFQGDQEKLQRIISNLMDNAIKYTPNGGTISIFAKTNEKKIDIIFEDTGPGIAEAEVPRIFERFYQCDRSRSKGGVGLGLSLVKAFTESMNGTISVISAINKGSRFAITFNK